MPKWDETAEARLTIFGRRRSRVGPGNDIGGGLDAEEKCAASGGVDDGVGPAEPNERMTEVNVSGSKALAAGCSIASIRVLLLDPGLYPANDMAGAIALYFRRAGFD